MRLVIQTLRDRIRTLPERWAGRFSHLPSWTDVTISREGSQKMTYDRICRLNLETCSPEDIRNVAYYLGGWIQARCGGCRRDVMDTVVVYEEEPDYDVEGCTVVMCRECIASGVSALKKAGVV